MEENEYFIKNITFLGRPVSILLQNNNGPCPLLALSNILLLQGKIFIEPDTISIDLHSLTTMVTNKILELNSPNDSDNPELQTQKFNQIESVLKIIPQLKYGLDVNVKFNDVTAFEYTEQLTIFDSLGIQLYHGWVLDPQYKNSHIILNNSYNSLVNKLVEYSHLSTKTQSSSKDLINPNHPENNDKDNNNNNDNDLSIVQDFKETNQLLERKLFEDSQTIQRFLDETANQLTYYGLHALYSTVKERELSIFFRNNHFATMVRYNKRLFLLATDAGFLNENEVVWELLDEIDGNTEYFNSSFSQNTQPNHQINSGPESLDMYHQNYSNTDPNSNQFLSSEENVFRNQNSSSISNPNINSNQASAPKTNSTSNKSSSSNRGRKYVEADYGETDEEFARRVQAQHERFLAGRRQVKVIIPAGSYPGASFKIAAPDGLQLNVRVPEGFQPGDEMIVEYDEPIKKTTQKSPKPCIIC